MSYTNGSLLDGTRLDARQATFLPSPTNMYPLNLAGGSGICVAGGALLGQFDRTLSWDDMHTLNNAAIRFENPDTHVEYVRIDNVTDGIRPVAGPFTVRGAWLTYVRDDCVENDHVQPGIRFFNGHFYTHSRTSPRISISRECGSAKDDLISVASTIAANIYLSSGGVATLEGLAKSIPMPQGNDLKYEIKIRNQPSIPERPIPGQKHKSHFHKYYSAMVNPPTKNCEVFYQTVLTTAPSVTATPDVPCMGLVLGG